MGLKPRPTVIQHKLVPLELYADGSFQRTAIPEGNSPELISIAQ